jgi:heme/copper-type cytochrome/quinol oxidase subunit 2
MPDVPPPSPRRSKADPLPVGAALGCALAMPLVAALPFVVGLSCLLFAGPESHPQSALFVLTTYGAIIAVPVIIGSMIGFAIKHRREQRRQL